MAAAPALCGLRIFLLLIAPREVRLLTLVRPSEPQAPELLQLSAHPASGTCGHEYTGSLQLTLAFKDSGSPSTPTGSQNARVSSTRHNKVISYHKGSVRIIRV